MKDILEKNKHIPTETVLQDITDTEWEIRQMTEEAEHLEATPRLSYDYKMNNFRASAKRSGIEERKKFCENLRELIHARGEAEERLNKVCANCGEEYQSYRDGYCQDCEVEIERKSL